MKRTIAFAENLKHYRTKLGLTQRQLAQEIGYTEKSVSKWESGGALPTMEMALTLADLFNLSLDELIFENNTCYYFLGIDGGGTKTTFKLIDKSGMLLSRISKGPSNPNDIGIEQTLAVLKDGINEVCKGIPYNKVTLFAGLAGFGYPGDSTNVLSRFLDKFGFFAYHTGNDIENIAALSNYDKCILVIMGTGFNVYAINGSNKKGFAGWGQLFDEGGCGYTLGRDAITAALCAEDGSGSPTLLTDLFTKRLGQTAGAHLTKFYQGGKRYIAEFADLAFRAAASGDSVAKEILEKNATFAAGKISAALRELNANAAGHSIPVIFAGGISKQHSVLFPLIRKHLTANCDLMHLEHEPVDGAVFKAKKLFEERTASQEADDVL
ncbi:MAG: XRE family transcriptional regulator [Oscillospiraceae bacterium]|nr:XRE family transcriptional regulator [Oscillospiraceae bacterium]